MANKTKLMNASNPRRTIGLNRISGSKITIATAQTIMFINRLQHKSYKLWT
ncbi:hypothetical protein MOC64_13950 [Bacillus inaquosorum]|nr:hypothetical protein [Bacillus inaquosorum]